jgi:hypothetical protein
MIAQKMPTDFTLMYVSGFVQLSVYTPPHGDPPYSSLLLYAFNNGLRPESVEMSILQIFENEPRFAFGAGPISILQQQRFALEYVVDDPRKLGDYWCRFYATSDEIVPCMLATNPFVPAHTDDLGGEVPDTPENRVYHAPSDFARFTLREPVVHPVAPMPYSSE